MLKTTAYVLHNFRLFDCHRHNKLPNTRNQRAVQHSRRNRAGQIGSQNKHDIRGSNPNRIRLNKLFSEFRKFNRQLKHFEPSKLPINASLVPRSSKRQSLYLIQFFIALFRIFHFGKRQTNILVRLFKSRKKQPIAKIPTKKKYTTYIVE